MVNSPEQSGLHRPKSSTRDTWRCYLMDYWEEYITRSRKATVCLRCAACAGISRIWIDMENVLKMYEHVWTTVFVHSDNITSTHAYICVFKILLVGHLLGCSYPHPQIHDPLQPKGSALIHEILWSCPNLYPTSVVIPHYQSHSKPNSLCGFHQYVNPPWSRIWGFRCIFQYMS